MMSRSVETTSGLATDISIGPYRSHRGHIEETRSSLIYLWWPWWFRYGVMKEASAVWQEAAMCFESTELWVEGSEDCSGAWCGAIEISMRCRGARSKTEEHVAG